MDITITPRKLSGVLTSIPSKSQAHRLLICAAFSDRRTTIYCPETNLDIQATADCLNALGARICHKDGYYTVDPIGTVPEKALLPCNESGSTLRFMLPIIGALGVDSKFVLSGRLSKRPLSPLWEEMERMGCKLSWLTESILRCTGRLQPGRYIIDGGVSSQFITGLLFAMALMDEKSTLTVTGKTESAPYIKMTQDALATFGVSCENYCVGGSRPFLSPGSICVEGDWSNAAFFLAANTLGNRLIVNNLNMESSQGDKVVLHALAQLKDNCAISGANIPDLIPILSVVAAANCGASFTEIGRLRLKESDRVNSVISMLMALGIRAEATETTLTVYPGKIRGGVVDSENDHRIAMSAAIAATVAEGPVTILGAQCVAKSYPAFWDEYRRLGGSYEQYIRK